MGLRLAFTRTKTSEPTAHRRGFVDIIALRSVCIKYVWLHAVLNLSACSWNSSFEVSEHAGDAQESEIFTVSPSSI